jgi:mRNA interferase MazF
MKPTVVLKQRGKRATVISESTVTEVAEVTIDATIKAQPDAAAADAIEKPPKIAPRLKSAPKIRQLYWCDFPKDAHLPEFWKRRPVIVLSFKNTLHGAVTVVPCSTQAQPDNPNALDLETTIDGRAAHAICDKVTTVAVSRLLPDKDGIKRLPEKEFNKLLELVLSWLPKLPEPPEPS